MAPTIFIALQCYQCSTMQVKQQKKSSNKWTCVVCNQKQSVRKVFAQGYMAKDLRTFVQSFNMSRSNQSLTQTLAPASQQDTDFNDHYHHQISPNQSKRRTDWTEYLDPEDNQKDKIVEDENEGGEFEAKIVTEMPREMFKKTKLDAITKGKEPNKGQRTKARGASKWSDYVTENDEEEPMSRQPTTAKRSSKWNDYITQNDDESGRDFADHVGHQWSNDVLENITNDDRVEDDIHPDFM